MLVQSKPVVNYQDTAQYAIAVAADLQRRDSQNTMPLVSEMRLDAMSAGHLQEYLTEYHPELIRQEFPEYKYAIGLVPLDSREYVGVQQIKRTRITRIGQWARSSDGNVSRAPIDIGMDDVDYGSVSFDAFITFTVDELDAIDFARRHRSMGVIVDTVREKVRAVEESYQELINRIMAFGSARQRAYGLHTHPGITKVKAPYKMGLNQTADNNIAIFAYMLRIISRISGQRSKPNVGLIPDQLAIDLSQQEKNTTAGISTLKYFLQSAQGVSMNFESTPEMDTAGPGGTTAIHFYRLDPTRLQGVIPKRMRQVTDPVYVNGVWRTDFHCAISGAHLTRPYDHVMFYDVYDLN